jgi:hypothetical protein
MKRFAAAMTLAVCLLLGGLGATVGLATTASAQTASAGTCYPSCSDGPPPVLSSTSNEPATTTTTTPVATSELAFTGSDVAGMAVIALALVGGGLILVRISRRRRAA